MHIYCVTLLRKFLNILIENDRDPTMIIIFHRRIELIIRTNIKLFKLAKIGKRHSIKQQMSEDIGQTASFFWGGGSLYFSS